MQESCVKLSELFRKFWFRRRETLIFRLSLSPSSTLAVAPCSTAMNFSPFSRILGPRDEYGNLVLPPRTISGPSSTVRPPERPSFSRSTSYTSTFSGSTAGSSTYASSPPTSSPSLGNLDSPLSEDDEDSASLSLAPAPYRVPTNHCACYYRNLQRD